MDTYRDDAAIPAWPFDLKLLLKLLGATVVPLNGITVWLPTLIGRILGG